MSEIILISPIKKPQDIKDFIEHVKCRSFYVYHHKFLNNNFEYVIPKSIKEKAHAENIYKSMMNNIRIHLLELEEIGIPREDVAMGLPLGMCTKITDKRNLRNRIDMSRQRMCNRAYWEYRELFRDYCHALKNYSMEWEYLVANYFKPKCEEYGYCEEKFSCGRKERRIDNEN